MADIIKNMDFQDYDMPITDPVCLKEDKKRVLEAFKSLRRPVSGASEGEDFLSFPCPFDVDCPAVLEIYHKIKAGKIAEITKTDEINFAGCSKERR